MTDNVENANFDKSSAINSLVGMCCLSFAHYQILRLQDIAGHNEIETSLKS